MDIYYALNNALSTHIIHILPKCSILYVHRGQSYQNNISDGCIGISGDNSDKKNKMLATITPLMLQKDCV